MITAGYGLLVNASGLSRLRLLLRAYTDQWSSQGSTYVRARNTSVTTDKQANKTNITFPFPDAEFEESIHMLTVSKAATPASAGTLQETKETKEGNLMSLVRQRRGTTVSESGQSVQSGDQDTRPMLKRRDTLKGVAKSITSTILLKRLTKGRIEPLVAPKPQVKYENTYRMKPDCGFDVHRVEQAAQACMTSIMGDMEYDQAECSKAACELSTLIKNTVKGLNLPRYKIVCQVVIGQVCDQGLESVSRCIWDSSTDNHTTVTHSNGNIFAIAIIHGLYHE